MSIITYYSVILGVMLSAVAFKKFIVDGPKEPSEYDKLLDRMRKSRKVDEESQAVAPSEA